ncbi:hypothetical protein OG474_24730 [Kribbella sp. NBC_01505]|uniref:hypothetical protein n=1 Tax=Kribbella sp. NBC_01505 TaxID=2903580 RepID=UPI00386857CC
MRGFAIEVIDSSSVEAVGRIVVGEFSETFRMSLNFWSVSDYRRSWQRELRALVSDERGTSCLMSSITDPEYSNYLMCWPLYRSGEEVWVHNSILFLEQLDDAFDPEEPWRSVGPRCVVDEDGNRISEWATGMTEVRAFLELSGE